MARGTWGILGGVVAGILMVIAGAVLFQLGSYFLADNYNAVYKNVAHPHVSKVLDVSTMITLFCIGFVLPFVGFADLVSWVYPVLGYLGMFLVAVLFASWIKNRGRIYDESDRRERLAEFAESQLDPATEALTAQERSEVRTLLGNSSVRDNSLWQSVREEVSADLDADPESEIELADHPHLDPEHDDYTEESATPGTLTTAPVTADLAALARSLRSEQVDGLPDGPVKRKILTAQGR